MADRRRHTLRIDNAAHGEALHSLPEIPPEELPDSSHTQALARLGQWLREEGFRFTAVSSATHARVNARPGLELAACLRDIFGWSRPFERSLLPDAAMALLEEGGVLHELEGGLLHCRVRFSTLGDSLYMHSAWPDTGAEAVPFGPDTYRFACLIERTLAGMATDDFTSVLDMGCGSGAAGITAWKALQIQAPQLLLADANKAALDCARVNVAMAGVSGVRFLKGDLYENVKDKVDLILASPPYLLDPQRPFHHGGGEFGGALSARMVVEGLPLLKPGGAMIVPTRQPVTEKVLRK